MQTMCPVCVQDTFNAQQSVPFSFVECFFFLLFLCMSVCLYARVWVREGETYFHVYRVKCVYWALIRPYWITLSFYGGSWFLCIQPKTKIGNSSDQTELKCNFYYIEVEMVPKNLKLHRFSYKLGSFTTLICVCLLSFPFKSIVVNKFKIMKYLIIWNALVQDQTSSKTTMKILIFMIFRKSYGRIKIRFSVRWVRWDVRSSYSRSLTIAKFSVRDCLLDVQVFLLFVCVSFPMSMWNE